MTYKNERNGSGSGSIIVFQFMLGGKEEREDGWHDRDLMAQSERGKKFRAEIDEDERGLLQEETKVEARIR